MTHDFDPTEPETFTSAHERFAELRRTCPVAHSTCGCSPRVTRPTPRSTASSAETPLSE